MAEQIYLTEDLYCMQESPRSEGYLHRSGVVKRAQHLVDEQDMQPGTIWSRGGSIEVQTSVRKKAALADEK